VGSPPPRQLPSGKNRRRYFGQEQGGKEDRLRTITDAEVIASSEKDPRLFGAIFERHYVAIHRYLHRRVGLDLAEDLASETFVVAFRRRTSYDAAQENARPWLFGIATNLLRRHRRTERRMLAAYAKTGADPLVAADQELDAAEDRAEAEAAGPFLAEALAALRPADRDVLLLYAWADLSYQEVAGALGVPVGTVRSRLARARELVRGLLAASGGVMDLRKGRQGGNDE
jgi:RNA polymerase sigma factor (sigma-70 family)